MALNDNGAKKKNFKMTTKAEFVIQRKSAAVHSIQSSRCTNPDLTKIDEDLLDLRNLQEQVKKAFCYQKLFRPFTVRINCSSDREKCLQILGLQPRISKLFLEL